MRAKAIKNKAKINAELSLRNSKSLLKKAQTQVTTFEQYVLTLDAEVQQWRAGESSTKRQMGTSYHSSWRFQKQQLNHKAFNTVKTYYRESSRYACYLRTISYPSLPLDKDEREEFLRRENELQDQIAEKETQIAAVEKTIRETKEELTYLKDHDTKTNRDNEKLTGG